MANILVIDSPALPLEGVVSNLKRAGMQVQETTCVCSSLELAWNDKPDLIVCSDDLPGLDALDLLELKSQENTLKDIATIIVGSSSERKLECFKLGCDDYITLPVPEAELFFRICALLRRIGPKGVRGSFSDISFLDLVQMLVIARRSGKLSLEFNDFKGFLYIDEGQVFHAILGNDLGEEAFLQILRKTQKGGAFIFANEDIGNIEKTIEKRTDHLLLGLANILDEESPQK